MKRTIAELDDAELKKVWDANSKLREDYANFVYERQMDGQYNATIELLSDDARKCYDYHDHYSSFFFTLKDGQGYKFMNCLNLKDMEDWSIMTKEEIEHYKQVKQSYEETYYDENDTAFCTYENELETIAKKTLASIEEMLHEYEQFCTEDELYNMWLEDLDLYCDLYVIGNDYVAYCDYTKCYK